MSSLKRSFHLQMNLLLDLRSPIQNLTLKLLFKARDLF
jgi:hypothetical protein